MSEVVPDHASVCATENPPCEGGEGHCNKKIGLVRLLTPLRMCMYSPAEGVLGYSRGDACSK